MSTAPDVPLDVQPTASNHFAWLNTQLALQQTVMAATRTAVSLIGFGFTVAQFFESLRSDAAGPLRLMRDEGPRNLGLALIGAGVISLALFTWQFHAAIAQLRTGVYQSIAIAGARHTVAPVYIVAGAVLLIGVAAFVTIYVQV